MTNWPMGPLVKMNQPAATKWHLFVNKSLVSFSGFNGEPITH